MIREKTEDNGAETCSSRSSTKNFRRRLPGLNPKLRGEKPGFEVRRTVSGRWRSWRSTEQGGLIFL